MTLLETEAECGAITIRVPLHIRKRGGRKFIIAPEGAGIWKPPPTMVDSTLVKALARAFRWKRLLESGVYNTIAEIAAAEGFHNSYVSRILGLTLLAPDIVDAILNGLQPKGLKLAEFTLALPYSWDAQREQFRSR